MQLLATSARPASTGRDDPTPDWSALLPAEWRAMADAPLRFVEYREYEMSASRCLGYDADDRLCYCAHHYLLETCRSDDDEEFYRAVTGGETLHAWRLRDGRWLVFRRPITDDCQPASRGFYSFAQSAPR
jgi:hypothetical protein